MLYLNVLIRCSDHCYANDAIFACIRQLNFLTGANHLRATAYHLAANGMVKKFYRQLEIAVTCHQNSRWSEILPTVMIGKRSTSMKDFQEKLVELLYTFKATYSEVTPLSEVPDTKVRQSSFCKHLKTTDQVLVRHDGTKQPDKKNVVINIYGRNVTVSIRRLKPAYYMTTNDTSDHNNENEDPEYIILERRQPVYSVQQPVCSIQQRVVSA
ncbi:uncharacterized protein LOC124431572 [Vespa crabro]|uniref:uncharacterized protein LOC124431572 n=1 Tax=Vespa crabro TaxID=7445 RepID=UPI001F01F8B9|nr:uncharacterized protein LOC124431572 [Vespa crabro]